MLTALRAGSRTDPGTEGRAQAGRRIETRFPMGTGFQGVLVVLVEPRAHSIHLLLTATLFSSSSKPQSEKQRA